MKPERMPLSLDGLELIRPHSNGDERGLFSEIRHPEWMPNSAQMNQSISNVCTFRGLHYQWDRPQGKLIRVDSGSAVFFELDIRSYSQTFGDLEIIELSSKKNEWLWVPPGFANGFFALENETRVTYMCTEKWSSNEGSISYRSILDRFPFRYRGDIRHISEKDEAAATFEDSIPHLESISDFFRNSDK